MFALVASREGVPLAAVSHQADAEQKEWYDCRDHCWHVRGPAGDVIKSEPVPQRSKCGRPLSSAEYAEAKRVVRARMEV